MPRILQSSLVRLTSLIALAAALTACIEVTATDDDFVAPGAADISTDITENRTFFAETTYTLTNYIHVQPGATLTIMPGTVIQGARGSALFVMRGARIVAEGRADAPIVFTSSRPVGSRLPGDWGGLIIIGNGVINRTGTIELEGTGTPASNPAINYGGGTVNADNSGVLSYVRVEFAGFGVAANQELNSFTFAAVGSGTRMDHLQALAGLDDSFEWFGGAVDAKYLVSYEAGDDHFDAAEGYVGRNQHLIAFQSTVLDPDPQSGILSSDPQGFEIDGCGSASGSGCTLGFNSTPLNIPVFANWTLVGTGPIARVTSTSGGIGMVLRRGTGGFFVNGILARWPRAAISLRDPDTQTRFNEGNAMVRNVSVVESGGTAGTNAPLFEGGSGRFTIDAAANNLVLDPGTVTATSFFSDLPATPGAGGQLDWSLTANASARTGGTGAFSGNLATRAGTAVTGTSYRGAWDPQAADGGKWWMGWTTYAQR
ncbi:MAG TPA: hypothetical protein VJ672_09030 [Gemmatimonadaceae bacterium]|nr:hypothetical protein [Gemmatimonadaceae bacterium]